MPTRGLFVRQPKAHVIKWRKLLKSKSLRRRTVRYSLLGVNLGLLAVIVGFITLAPSNNTPIQAAPAAIVAGNASNPLDLLSSADVAESVASVANLPEATAVRNQADTVNAELAVTPAEAVVISKPQVVATASNSRAGIQTYVVKAGDTAQSLALRFDVTSNSILWSNNLASSNLITGSSLVIPPANGIVYTVKAGDTAQSLAQKYSSNAQQITSFNDAELTGLTPGEQIVIPNGQIQPTALRSSFSSSPSSSPAYSFTASYGSNGYDYGFCTWYVASQIAVPGNWGNASSWAYYASLTSGWSVVAKPIIGAIAQTANAAGGEGHVAIVDNVSDDGSMIQFKDMNGIAGYGRVGQSGWVSSSAYQNYITH